MTSLGAYHSAAIIPGNIITRDIGTKLDPNARALNILVIVMT